jgi:hypothetical protein
MNTDISVGDLVEFTNTDAYYKGIVVAIFYKLDGYSQRCVVEDDRGLLLIKNPKQAIKING